MLELVVLLIEGTAENVARIAMATDSLLPFVNDIQRLSNPTVVHSEQMIQSLEHFAKSNKILADVINRLALSQQTPESNGRHENIRNNFRSNLRTMHLSDINTEFQSQARRVLRCSCRSFSQAQAWEPLSILHFGEFSGASTFLIALVIEFESKVSSLWQGLSHQSGCFLTPLVLVLNLTIGTPTEWSLFAQVYSVLKG